MFTATDVLLSFIVGAGVGSVFGYLLCISAVKTVAREIVDRTANNAHIPTGKIIEEPDNAENISEEERERRLQADPEAWKNF